MTKFQPGDAVFVLGVLENRKREVTWTHPGGRLTVEYFPRSGGEQEVVAEADVVFAHPMLKYFAYAHLPEKLQATSKPFGRLAHMLVLETPYEQTNNDQLYIALQKLLEAKDAAVRARLA